MTTKLSHIGERSFEGASSPSIEPRSITPDNSSSRYLKGSSSLLPSPIYTRWHKILAAPLFHELDNNEWIEDMAFAAEDRISRHCKAKYCTSNPDHISRFMANFFTSSIAGSVAKYYDAVWRDEGSEWIQRVTLGTMAVDLLHAALDRDDQRVKKGLELGSGREGGGPGDPAEQGDEEYTIYDSYRGPRYGISPVTVTVPVDSPTLSVRARGTRFSVQPRTIIYAQRAYDPLEVLNPDQSRKRYLFHGTRSEHLYSFRLRGADPPPGRANECADVPAFFTTNILAHAYAHPAFVKPPLNAESHVVVLVYEVDAAVINGEVAPPGRSQPFEVIWYGEDEFVEFATYNLTQSTWLERDDHADFVIAPVCTPTKEPTKYGLKILPRWDDVDADLALWQVAACTPEARAYLDNNVHAILKEA